MNAAVAVTGGIDLFVNGEGVRFAGGNILDLITELEVDRRKVAIEHNHQIVPRSLYAATSLAQGDRIEIVHFIGGG
jgi:thiamine biosynthesis protein ThiS